MKVISKEEYDKSSEKNIRDQAGYIRELTKRLYQDPLGTYGRGAALEIERTLQNIKQTQDNYAMSETLEANNQEGGVEQVNIVYQKDETGGCGFTFLPKNDKEEKKTVPYQQGVEVG